MTDLVVFCPTYGRPENARRLQAAFAETCEADTKLVFVVELDDPKLDEYRSLVTTRSLWVRHEPDKPGMVAALNWGWSLLESSCYSLSDCPWGVGFMGDDHLPKTKGWDRRYVDSILSGNAVVWGNDLIQGEKMPTQVALSSDIPLALGYMAPKEFFHLCIDLVWKDWGEGLGRLEYLPDVIVEHLHPSASKGEWDDNYERVNDSDVVQRDSDTYFEWKRSRLPRELEGLRFVYGVG